MSKKPSTASGDLDSSILPLPPAVLTHHGQQLDPLLSQWSFSTQVSPVLLITGPSGIGKRAIASYLAQWLLCEGNPLSEAPAEEAGLFVEAPVREQTKIPCGSCSSCRAMLTGQPINFTEISAEASETGRVGTLKIEQFRGLRENQGFGAYQGKFRIVLISGADQMTVPAGNSLLKLLEEPPPGWIFFLTAADPSLVLPTLVSRCQKMRLRPFSSIQLEALLAEAEIPADRRRICAELAQGSWGRALSLADNETWEQRAKLLRFIENPAAELEQWVDWAAKDANQFSFVVDQLELLSSLLIKMSLSDEATSVALPSVKTYFDRVVRLRGSKREAREFWLHCSETLSVARDRQHLPLNRKLLTQQVLMPWLQGS